MASLRLVGNPPPANPGETIDVYEGAALIAEVLHETGAKMRPLDDPIRGLALRSAEHWRTLAGTAPIDLSPPPGLRRLVDGGE
jgi:hypothetical protein